MVVFQDISVEFNGFKGSIRVIVICNSVVVEVVPVEAVLQLRVVVLGTVFGIVRNRVVPYGIVISLECHDAVLPRCYGIAGNVSVNCLVAVYSIVVILDYIVLNGGRIGLLTVNAVFTILNRESSYADIIAGNEDDLSVSVPIDYCVIPALTHEGYPFVDKEVLVVGTAIYEHGVTRLCIVDCLLNSCEVCPSAVINCYI